MAALSPLSSGGLLLIEPRRHEDERGWFAETYSAARLSGVGIDCPFVQDNQSWSRNAGTVRGLHFQRPPGGQAKLVSCLKGRILDMVVDLRAGSPSYGDSLAVELTDNGEQLFVPVGYAHGFMTLTDDVRVAYKVSSPYTPALEMGIRWNDPVLGIAWPTTAAEAILSPRDRAWPLMSQFDSPFAYDGGPPLELTRIKAG